MIFKLFLRGAMFGMMFGVPIGAIGILTVKHTIEHGSLCGLFTGMSSAFADLLYGFIAVSGISMATNVLEKWELPIRLGGCLVIIVYGIFILFHKPGTENTRSKAQYSGKMSPWICFITTLPIALSNPVTIVSFSAGFASVGIMKEGIMWALVTAAGIFVGAGVWWFILVFAANNMKDKINDRMRVRMRKISGIIMICIGLVIAINASGSFLQ